jgi:cytochrome c peroxidase
MGYSGQNGDPNLSDLINKLNGLDYYQELVAWAYQDPKKTKKIDENTLQECLSQFIRSIQSFDSKYDQGRSQLPLNANNDNLPNFTTSENNGRALFTNPPVFNDTGLRIAGGLGCGGCHRAPEFDIDPNSRNNGFVGNNENPNILDLGNTRSPTLRDAVNQNGIPNGPFMHTGVQTSLAQVMGHYGRIQVRPGNNNIDPRLTPRGFPQRLNLTTQERADVIAFLETLSGNSVYTDKKWSDPFN